MSRHPRRMQHCCQARSIQGPSERPGAKRGAVVFRARVPSNKAGGAESKEGEMRVAGAGKYPRRRSPASNLRRSCCIWGATPATFIALVVTAKASASSTPATWKQVDCDGVRSDGTRSDGVRSDSTKAEGEGSAAMLGWKWLQARLVRFAVQVGTPFSTC